MSKIVIQPSFKDFAPLICLAIAGGLVAYAGYLGSWTLNYDIHDPSNAEVTKQFEFGIGFLFIVFGLAIVIGAIEFFARKVKIDEKIIESVSPLRIYNQFYRIEDIRMARLTPLGIRARALELLNKDKWIVFVSNQRFKDSVFDYFPNANDDERI